MFDISQVNFANIIYEVIRTILITGSTAVITYLICKHYYKYIDFAKRMGEYGFEHSVVIDQINYKKIFQKAKSIKMMYVSAYGFFTDPMNIRFIEYAAQKGTKMMFLFAKKHTSFIEDIMKIERTNGTRTVMDINNELDTVSTIIYDIKNKYPQTQIEVRYYSSEYRMPILVATYETKEGHKTHGYLNITFPPSRSNDHILLSGVANDSELESGSHKNIVKIINDHFDSVWEQSEDMSTANMKT